MNSGDSNQNEGYWLNVELLYIIFLTLNNRRCVVQFKDKPIISCLHHPTSLPSFFFGTMVPQALTIDSEWVQRLASFISLVASCSWRPLCLGRCCRC